MTPETICLHLLPLQGHTALLLQQAGHYLSDADIDQGQVGQGPGVQVAKDDLEQLQGKVCQGLAVLGTR